MGVYIASKLSVAKEHRVNVEGKRGGKKKGCNARQYQKRKELKKKKTDAQ